jgi:hypothetical protein
MFCRLSLAQPSRRIRLEIDAEQLLFLRCLCQIICRLKFGTVPATEESKKARCSSAAFPKLFRSRNTCFPFYSVAALLRNIASPPWLSLGIKDLLKEEVRLLDEERIFWMKGGFWVKGDF